MTRRTTRLRNWTLPPLKWLASYVLPWVVLALVVHIVGKP